MMVPNTVIIDSVLISRLSLGAPYCRTHWQSRLGGFHHFITGTLCTIASSAHLEFWLPQILLLHSTWQHLIVVEDFSTENTANWVILIDNFGYDYNIIIGPLWSDVPPICSRVHEYSKKALGHIALDLCSTAHCPAKNPISGFPPTI